jgi:hypothetical protein
VFKGLPARVAAEEDGATISGAWASSGGSTTDLDMSEFEDEIRSLRGGLLEWSGRALSQLGRSGGDLKMLFAGGANQPVGRKLAFPGI